MWPSINKMDCFVEADRVEVEGNGKFASKWGAGFFYFAQNGEGLGVVFFVSRQLKTLERCFKDELFYS